LLFELHKINGSFHGGHSINFTNREGKRESWFVSVKAQKDGKITSAAYATAGKVFHQHDFLKSPKNNTTEIFTIESTRKIHVTIYAEGHKRYPPSPNQISGDFEIIEVNT